VQEHFRTIVAGQAVELATELRMRVAQGGYADFLVRGKLFGTRRVRLIRIVGTLVDITAKKQAEKRHKVSEAKTMAG